MTETQTAVHPLAADAPPGVVAGDRYELGAEIAGGGMGLVLTARDRVLGREVAVKVLRPELAGRTGLVARFVEEARITAQLQHPGIPPVYDLGTLPDGRPFLAMKLIKGRTLAALLKERPDPSADLPRFLTILEAICQAVGYAHSKGVIHRDLKPANVMVGAFGEVQVMDWGLAKVLTPVSREAESAEPSADAPPQSVVDTGRGAADVTQAGSLMGTPAYMPPEQAKGEVDRVDRRADVFALGAVLCEVLTGYPPYNGKRLDVLEQAAAGSTGPALERLEACGAGRELLDLCHNCLQFDPAKRPDDAAAIAGQAVAIRTEAEQRDRAATVNRTHVEERSRRVANVFCAISLVNDVRGDRDGALWWLRAVRDAIASAERYVHDYCRTLDQYGRPDLAYRLAENSSVALPDLTRQPDSAYCVGLAWYALRWAVGVDYVEPPADRPALADAAMRRLESGPTACRTPDALTAWVSLVRSWPKEAPTWLAPSDRPPTGLRLIDSWPTRTGGAGWEELFGHFPALRERWRWLMERTQAVTRG